MSISICRGLPAGNNGRRTHARAAEYAHIDQHNDVQKINYSSSEQLIISESSCHEPEEVTPNPVGQNYRRKLQGHSEAEAWLNRNRHGHWNRLHTHEGAAWSGVYYAHSSNSAAAASYSGKLLLKPSAHRSEESYTMTPVELERLNCQSVCETKEQSSGW